MLSKSRKRRFMRLKTMMKKLPENEDARKMAMHVYDIN
jgi:hypothetical protein